MTSPFDSWAQLSDLLVQSAIAVLALAFLAYAVDLATRRTVLAGSTAQPVVRALVPDREQARPPALTDERVPAVDGVPTEGAVVGRIGSALSVVGVAMVLVAIVARGVAAERVPWGNMYEFAVTGAAAAGTAYLLLLSRQPVRDLGVWIVGLVLLTLGLAATVLYTPVDDLVPVLDSYWLVVHVAAAIIAGGLYTVGFVATCLVLFRTWRNRRSPQVPSPVDGIERVSRTMVLVAFPIWTFAVMAGAIWAENAWGRYWGWDPKETWAFITWTFYAAYLHATATAGWRGNKASLLAVAGYLAFLFNFFGVNIWLPGLHSYAGV